MQRGGYTVARIPVPPESLVDRGHSYADTFELRLDRPDSHSAEEWVRAAVEQAPSALLRLVRLVHGRVARFALSTDDDSVLGWRAVSSTPDAFHLATEGPDLRAEIVARRTSPTSAVLTTFLYYQRRRTRILWLVVGPLHRRVAPYLLRCAAARLTTGARATSRRSGPAS